MSRRPFAGANTCVVLASRSQPLSAVSFAEVLHASDLPGGVVNVLTGFRDELDEQFASHMDVNAIVYCEGEDGVDPTHRGAGRRQRQACLLTRRQELVRRISAGTVPDRRYQEIKTIWHPVGS
jgi:acyl-CoA reductase-like NAD-dependent aldehyde dehydrogenase